LAISDFFHQIINKESKTVINNKRKSDDLILIKVSFT